MAVKKSPPGHLIFVGLTLAILLVFPIGSKLLDRWLPISRPDPHPSVVTFLNWASAYVDDDQPQADIQRYEDSVAVVFGRLLDDHIDAPTERDLIGGAADGIEALNPVFGGESGPELAVAAIDGMMAGLGPHSYYIPPEEMPSFREDIRGNFAGLGIELTQEGSFLRIVSPFDDTPAYRAELAPGDLISHIDGLDARGMTVDDAVAVLRGDAGSEVTLRIVRSGSPAFDVTITRDTIRLIPVKHRLIEDVGFVRLAFLSGRTVEDVEEAIEAILEESAGRLRGVVLDLRRNPGGLVDSGVALSDLLLDGQAVGTLRRRRSEDDLEYWAGPGDRLEGYRLAVLIDAGTAGVSEWVVGSLQDHSRAVLIGARTAGHGTRSELYELDQYGALWVTNARYETPTGRVIDGVGIIPDIQIGPSTSTVAGYGDFVTDRCLGAHPDGGEDAALGCALAFLRSSDIGRLYDRLRD